MEHTGFEFVPLHNSGDYPQSMGSAKEQAIVTENFWQNQAMFQKYTAVDVTAVEPVFLSPLVDHLTGFGQVSALNILQHLFSGYGLTDNINLEEN